MRRLAILTTLALAPAALCALAAPAQASTLRAFEGQETSHSSDEFRVTYIGAPGEPNRLTAAWDATTQTLTVTDTGATAITVLPPEYAPDSEPCTATGQTAVCRPTSPFEVAHFHLMLGDLDDTAWLDHGAVDSVVIGGPGDDALTVVGAGPADLVGQAGDDDLRGGAGPDVLHGGFGADRFDGGAGADRVTAVNQTIDPLEGFPDDTQDPATGVSISLDGIANDGVAGEGDNVLATNEEIWGTDFADVLAGGAGNQTLVALGGDDRLRGGAGSDAFRCGAGLDSATLDVFDVLRGPDLTDGTCEIVGVTR